MTFSVIAPVTGNLLSNRHATKSLAIEAAEAMAYEFQIDLDVVDDNQSQVARVYADGIVIREAGA